jgi:hypothetical protein
MTSAAFTINGTAVPQSTGLAVQTTYATAVQLALASVRGAVSIDWSIAGVSGTGFAAPTITAAGSPPGATASFTTGADPGNGSGVGYGVRCAVTDARGSVYEAHGVVGVPSTIGRVPLVPGEGASWRHPTMGWVPEYNASLVAVAAYTTGPTGATGSTGATGPTGPAGGATSTQIVSASASYTVGTSTSVTILTDVGRVWYAGLNGSVIGTGIGTGSNQTVTFTPAATQTGSGFLVLLGEGAGSSVAVTVS